MKKKKFLSLLGIALLTIPTIVVLADTQQQYFAAYTIGTTASQTQQYMELTTKENDGYKYQNSNFTVSNMLADSGGDGSYCSFLQTSNNWKEKRIFGNLFKLKKSCYSFYT